MQQGQQGTHVATEDVDLHDEEEHASHPLPVGALVIMLSYLLMLSALWVQVYLQMLNSGGVPR
jgi:hypothetical protein